VHTYLILAGCAKIRQQGRKTIRGGKWKEIKWEVGDGRQRIEGRG